MVSLSTSSRASDSMVLYHAAQTFCLPKANVRELEKIRSLTIFYHIDNCTYQWNHYLFPTILSPLLRSNANLYPYK